VPGDEYRLRELETDTLGPGAEVVVDDVGYTVARLGPSPLPGDERRCAYLVRRPESA
jgi:hypothetical protein